ncbi:hypothetical protein BS78_03G289200 [Paspalum vaginatum]|nr:hypothetical protein BS78_03G289200 [Paspalum vaginatum]
MRVKARACTAGHCRSTPIFLYCYSARRRRWWRSRSNSVSRESAVKVALSNGHARSCALQSSKYRGGKNNGKLGPMSQTPVIPCGCSLYSLLSSLYWWSCRKLSVHKQLEHFTNICLCLNIMSICFCQTLSKTSPWLLVREEETSSVSAGNALQQLATLIARYFCAICIVA